MNTILLVKRFFLALTIIFFVSCDKDFTEIGANVVDGDIHNNLIKFEAGITAYDRPTGIVQTNNLPVNTLGVYDNPVFGKTIAQYLTQVQMASTNINPTFVAPTIDSVWIYIPYYSKVVTAATTSLPVKYTLDSIYGDTTSVFKLDIKRNNYFLRDSDGASGGTAGQKYYSDDQSAIAGAPGASVLDGGAKSNFRFSAEAITRVSSYTNTAGEAKTAKEVFAPGMFLYLDVNTVKDILFPTSAGTNPNLLNNTVFKNYLRGLFFEVTENGPGVMGALNFASGVITVKYKDDVTVNSVVTRTAKTFTLNLTGGNTVNFFNNTFTGEFISAVNTSNSTAGDERLYIKGGEGSMAFLDIDLASLAPLMHDDATGKRVLINEANLVFYVDQQKMTPLQDIFVANTAREEEPMRLYLYDVNNKRPVYDYYTDGTSVTSYPKYSKYIYGGLLERDKVTKRGTQYKIRITDHINNLVNKDSINVKLGLVVTEAISNITSVAVKTPWTEPWNTGVPPVPGTVPVALIPTAAVMHEFGTVLYGNNIPEGSADYDKRLKLEIFYTKPE